jgi:hypothetical protein
MSSHYQNKSYIGYTIEEIEEDIEKMIKDKENDEIITYAILIKNKLELCYNSLKELDKYMDGDNGEESFISSLKEKKLDIFLKN